MADSKFQFHYTPTGTGVISGPEVLQQTEDAINDVGAYADQASDNSEEALSIAKEARQTAQTANSTSSNALAEANAANEKVETLKQVVDDWDADIQTAIAQSKSAVDASTVAVTTANSAQTSASAAQTAAQGSAASAQTAANNAAQSLQTAQAAQQAAETAQSNAETAQTAATTAQTAAQTAEKAQTRLDDALGAYLTSTLEPAQRDYNEHYVCDYPLGLAGVEQYRAQHDSLVRIDLERYAARLEQAQRDCKDRFRKDILFRMKDDIFNARRQFRELNKVMEQLTYGEEVYRFELEPSRDPQLAAFYQVIVDKGNQQMTDGDSLDNLAATADPVYERQVDALMEKIMADVDENTRARQEGRTTSGATLSDYVDYRTYLDYDIKVTNTVSGQQAYLSRVSRDSSGGENQAPFYVAICASLLQIYQKSENSIRLVLLDEAFSKMTSDRIRPMMELFRRLQLQVLLISTVEKSTAIQPYCDITYSIVRHGDANAIAPFYRADTLADAPEKETEYE